MKRILLLVFLSVLATGSFSQTLIGLYGGAGLATSNNYDVGISGGLDFAKAIGNKTWLGANVFYQGFSLNYDNEANSARHGDGIAGFIERNSTGYVFVAPKLVHDVTRNGLIKFYVNVGVGFKMSGFDSVHKWNHSYDSINVRRYDSTNDNSKNINSMLVRVGTGFIEYMHLGGNWWFTFTEDFGFIGGSLVKTGEANPAQTPYSAQKLNPGYISLQIGITHYKYRRR